MRTPLKVFATLAVFSVFYAGAFLVMNGTKVVESRVEAVVFPNKDEAVAIANVERDKSQERAAVPASGIWK